jgi:hypothetical protein
MFTPNVAIKTISGNPTILAEMVVKYCLALHMQTSFTER